jgi:hypothetical protein
MSALMTPRRSRRTRRDASRRPAGQSSLFASAAAAAAAPAAPPVEPEPARAPDAAIVATPEREPAAAPDREAIATGEDAVLAEAVTEPAAEAVPETFTTASARRHGPTLDDLVAGAWEGLLARAPADCLVCGTPLTPRQSAGAGVVGGRCDGCGSTLG